jgi:hypothetical protein
MYMATTEARKRELIISDDRQGKQISEFTIGKSIY